MSRRIVCHCDAYAFPHRASGGKCGAPKHIGVIGQYRYALEDVREEREMRADWNADRAASIRSIGGIVR